MSSMELVFPFKNIATNYLFDFLSADLANKFIADTKGDYDVIYLNNFHEDYIKPFANSLPNFQNELLQVISTTNQETIDAYFDELKSEEKYIREQFRTENVRDKILEWNKEIMQNFLNEVERDSKNYFSKEERKYKHLEQYKKWVSKNLFGPPLSADDMVERTFTNHNFYCIEKQPELVEIAYVDQYAGFLNARYLEWIAVTIGYIVKHNNGEIKSARKENLFQKPVVFMEGEHDLTYVRRASSLLGYEDLLARVDLRQRGGYTNLDKMWEVLRHDNWETVPQKKLLLYDCDVNNRNDTFGDLFRRTIPLFPENPVQSGIENLFNKATISKALTYKSDFIDETYTRRKIRGQETEEVKVFVNKDEKGNMCKWLCENGTADDFVNFKGVFDLIQLIL